MDLNTDGYVVQKGLVETEFLRQIKNSIEALFEKQMDYTNAMDIYDLFENHNDREVKSYYVSYQLPTN